MKYKLLVNGKVLFGGDDWLPLPAEVSFTSLDFQIAVIKIDDVVYTEFTPKFRTEYERHKTWDILQNDSK